MRAADQKQGVHLTLARFLILLTVHPVLVSLSLLVSSSLFIHTQIPLLSCNAIKH